MILPVRRTCPIDPILILEGDRLAPELVSKTRALKGVGFDASIFRKIETSLS